MPEWTWRHRLARDATGDPLAELDAAALDSAREEFVDWNDVEADDWDEQAFLRWLDEPLSVDHAGDELEQWMSTVGAPGQAAQLMDLLGIETSDDGRHLPRVFSVVRGDGQRARPGPPSRGRCGQRSPHRDRRDVRGAPMSDAHRIAAIMDAVLALTAEIAEEQTGSGEDRSPRVRALLALVEDNLNALVDQLRSEAVPTRTPPRW